jgi:hypothetical protein
MFFGCKNVLLVLFEPGDRWHLSVLPTLVLARSSNATALALIRLTNGAKPLPYGSVETKGEHPLRGQAEREAGSCTFCQRRWRVYCCAVRQNERHCAVLARSTNAACAATAALACIRLTNAAAQLPYGSGETKGELLLRSQVERKAASASHSGKTKGEGLHLHFPNYLSKSSPFEFRYKKSALLAFTFIILHIHLIEIYRG